MQDYTYIIARLRSLEALMPDRAWFQRLARTSEEGLLVTLREQYRGFEPVDSPYDFEMGIEAEKAAVLELISSLITDEETITFVRVGYDFDNVTHMMKARLLRETPALSGYGLVDPETVAHAVTGSEWGLLPEHLKEFGARLELAGEEHGVAAVEYSGESEKWRYLLESAPARSGRDYIRWKIDCTNIKNFIRLKRVPLRTEEPGRVWIGGGELDTDRLSALFREPEGELYSMLAFTDYRGLIGLGLSVEIPLWKIDILLDRFLLDLLGESRYRFFDLSPVLYHLELIDRDMRLLRMIVSGLLNRMPEEIIAGRMDTMLPS
ncbi:MAG: V-type ATPase subunit [bacterium]|nr:MAG: V-type ATPase subunit [bacterium]